MTAVSTPSTSSSRRAGTASRLWHLLIAVDVGVALVIQLGLILTGGPDPNTGEAVASVGIGTRMIQTLSYFTIQSNILVLIVAITLVLDPHRDGRVWRILRLDALLGITITGLVFDLVLIRYVHPSGWQLAATIGFHYIAPWATLLGWLLFGPRPRIDRRTVAWAFLWPMAWIAYTFIRGALVGWYPYPFLDVVDIGYGASIRNTAFVLAVAIVLVAVFMVVDRFRTVGAGPRPGRGPRSGAPDARPSSATR
ncbi:Pr6Pr family membrane protein [Actinomycetospora rhizophila]|uniref:Pr6Pr family membrane protein n=1 Tax=Actinomycetospora rhizophila TaxID=1416876 RepID=A0ABV9ZBU1_9PSEU